MLSVTTPTQIRNNPVNNSTSKHQWSFSRASRFKNPRTKYKLVYLVAPSQPTIIAHVCLKEKHRLGTEVEQLSLMGKKESLTQENMKLRAISIFKKKIKDIALLPTEKTCSSATTQKLSR